MNYKKINNNLLVLIILLTSFLLGVFFTLILGKYLDSWLLKTQTISTWTWNYSLWELDLSKYSEVYELINNVYIDIDEVSEKDLIDWSINWLVDWIWDRHSDYFTPEEYVQFNESLSWDFEWIWAVIEINPLWVRIQRLIKGSPAIKNDLRSWDILISANWVDLAWLSLIEAVNNIKWPAWTTVELEVLREWQNNIITKQIVRDQIKIPSVDYEELENNIWYIALNMFWQQTFNEFQEALLDLKNTDWLIIDLRDNWGWYLLSAVEILSKFIPNWKELVITKYKEPLKNYSYKSNNFWYLYEGKIVVLINENSASASEIVAWALSDYDKAIIVWKKSFWKWSVQEPFELDDWSMVKLTIAKWFTPKWTSIDEQWIEPDIEVSFIEEDFENQYDRQKEEAKSVLLDYISKDNLNLVIEDYEDIQENITNEIQTWTWSQNQE